MRLLLLSFVLVVPSISSGMAAERSAGSCDKYVGVWEYVEPSMPGRSIIAKHGGKYSAVWINTARDRKATTTAPSTEAEMAEAYSTAGATAAEAMTCGPTRDRWRILYSTNPADVGTEFEIDTEFTGDGLKWWIIGPDGKRGAPGAARRLK
jgi:hypothetical protein